MRLRQSYLCGDSNAVNGFESIAEAASRALTDVPEIAECEYAGDIVDLFRQPHGGIRYVFGKVIDPPPFFVAQSWQTGVLVYDEGVLIDLPIAEREPGVGHWLLLLHRLGWRRVAGSPLCSQQLAWHENTTVPYEWVVQREFDPGLPNRWREQFSQIPTTSYYSIIGDREHPLDVNLASAFAIGLLLSTKPRTLPHTKAPVTKTDYSKEDWHNRTMPAVVSDASAVSEIRRKFKPKVALLTATPTERDTVLKNLEPLPGVNGVLRVFHEKNAYFIGQLGQYPIVLCMSGMGASGRDSAQVVSGEMIRFWKPTAVIMVGIAFGRSPDLQRIGDVLISKEIIAYEPARIGQEASIPRGQRFYPGPCLWSRFRNSEVDWCFLNPNGISCKPHFGPILSGEKLIDNPDFKGRLFQTYPNAIGGEMEGVGLAAAADREKCEWILVKAICDWADGEKSDNHQGFGAAVAVSYVRHVLGQPGMIHP
jgi:nucleoside phosphorylase